MLAVYKTKDLFFNHYFQWRMGSVSCFLWVPDWIFFSVLLLKMLLFILLGMNCRFIYTFLGLGITVCVITCSGHIAADTANGCCLYLVSFCFFYLCLSFCLYGVNCLHALQNLPGSWLTSKCEAIAFTVRRIVSYWHWCPFTYV